MDELEKKAKRKMLLELSNGIFDGKEFPNNTAAEHDKYLYGNTK